MPYTENVTPWAICWASSRVGASTTACGLGAARSINSQIGTLNAAVFPVPVFARATIFAG